MENIRILDWDSEFFGYSIASVTAGEMNAEILEGITGELRSKGIKLAYVFVSPDDKISNDLLESRGVFLADEKVTFSRLSMGENELPDSSNIVPYNSVSYSEKLVSLTLQSGIYSRFKVDPLFRNNEFERLYTEWIRKSVSRQIAEEVLVYKEQDEIYGFITLAIHDSVGSIGLIAVDETQRGKAIGKKLIGAAMNFFHEKEMVNVDVVTQKANYVACRFYESCGFRIKSIVNIYHLWIS